MTRKDLIGLATDAEFSLAMHCRAASWAINSTRYGSREGARMFGRDARDFLATYLAIREDQAAIKYAQHLREPNLLDEDVQELDPIEV